jgi:hypothetical protein
VKKALIAVLCALAFAIVSGTTFAASPGPAATANAEALARAKTWFAALQNANVDRTQLTDEANRALTEEMLKSVAGQISPLGEPTSFDQVQTGSQSGSTYYVYRIGFKNGDHWNFIFAFDGTGKVSGLRIAPAH